MFISDKFIGDCAPIQILLDFAPNVGIGILSLCMASLVYHMSIQIETSSLFGFGAYVARSTHVVGSETFSMMSRSRI